MNAERLLAHYERIADAPDAIPRLRRFILDLAVRGKLVPQDPKDEPASELLKRIAAEKARLVKAGEIKKPKALLPISRTSSPFDLPRVGVGDSSVNMSTSYRAASAVARLATDRASIRYVIRISTLRGFN